MVSSKSGGEKSEVGYGLFQPGLRALFLVVILIVIAISQFDFGRIDRSSSPNYRALRGERTDLFRVSIDRNPSSQWYVAPFYYFGLISPDSTLILPSSRAYSWFDLDIGMMSFGRAQKLEFRDYNLRTPLAVPDLEKYKVDLRSSVPSSEKSLKVMDRRFSIFRASPDAKTFVVFAPEGNPGRRRPMLFVDIDLLDESMQKALR